MPRLWRLTPKRSRSHRPSAVRPHRRPHGSAVSKSREERETSRGSEAREPSRGSAEVLSQPAILHGMATIRGVPRDTLSSLPKELAYEWQEGPTGGLAGTRLVFLARGGDKMVFEAEEMILKLSFGYSILGSKVFTAAAEDHCKNSLAGASSGSVTPSEWGSAALPQYVHVVPGQSASGFRTPRSKRSFVRLPLPCICGVFADLCDVAQDNSKGYGRQQYRGQAEHGVRFLPGGGFLRYPVMEAGSESQLQMGWMV